MSTRTPATAGRRKGEWGKLTTADLVVLSLLSERPMHGYALMREYVRQEVEDWARISRPHVYYALQKLAAGGLITAAPIHEGDRARVVYHLELAGSAALAKALADTTWAAAAPPVPFITWLGLSIHARPMDRRRVMMARRAYLAAAIERERTTLTAIRADVGPRVSIAIHMVTLALRQYETEAAWLDELSAAP